MAYLVDNTDTASAQVPMGNSSKRQRRIPWPVATRGGGDAKDLVGQSPRAGLVANNNAKQFLVHHDSIQILWNVSLLFFA